MPKQLPSQDIVRQLLHYNKTTGEFTWRIGQHAKKKAGTINPGRTVRLIIKIEQIQYKAHRLAWLYIYGEPVPDLIDHIDQNGLNNSIDNLRAADSTLNALNTKLHNTNSSGYRGVVLDKRNGRFLARTEHRGRCIHFGSFDTPEEAAKAYADGIYKLHNRPITEVNGTAFLKE